MGGYSNGNTIFSMFLGLETERQQLEDRVRERRSKLSGGVGNSWSESGLARVQWLW